MMRTQIILLERHDDVVSARDKMAWGKAGRILLVWPERGRILTRVLDLVLLVRHCTALGAELGIVTKDHLVRDNARKLRLPCFASVEHARRGRWRRVTLTWHPERNPGPHSNLRGNKPARTVSPAAAWMTLPGSRLAVFLTGLLAVFALCGFLLPGARIDFVLPRVEQSIRLPVMAGEAILHVSPAGLLPLKTTRFTVEGQEGIPASGWTLVPDQHATGTVQFSNLTDQEIVIPSGTVVMAVAPEKIRFITTREGRLAAGINTTSEIPVRSMFPGTQGNLPKNAVQAIEGQLGIQLSVENSEPTEGGSDRLVRSPDTADRARLRSRLVDQLTAQAREDIRTRLGKTASIMETTLMVKEILEEEISPEIGQPADILEMNLRVEFQASFVEESDLQALARMALEANLPEGYQPANEPIQIQAMEDFRLDSDGRLVGQIQASRWLVSPIQAHKWRSM